MSRPAAPTSRWRRGWWSAWWTTPGRVTPCRCWPSRWLGWQARPAMAGSRSPAMTRSAGSREPSPAGRRTSAGTVGPNETSPRRSCTWSTSATGARTAVSPERTTCPLPIERSSTSWSMRVWWSPLSLVSDGSTHRRTRPSSRPGRHSPTSSRSGATTWGSAVGSSAARPTGESQGAARGSCRGSSSNRLARGHPAPEWPPRTSPPTWTRPRVTSVGPAGSRRE